MRKGLFGSQLPMLVISLVGSVIWQPVATHHGGNHMIEQSCLMGCCQETEKEEEGAGPHSLFKGTPLTHSDLTSFSLALSAKGSTTSQLHHTGL